MSLRNALTFVVALTVMWAFLLGLVILGTGVPETRTQWIVAVIAGPPLYLAGEVFLGWLFSKEHGERISAKPFSWLRIVVALAVMLIFFGAVVIMQLETR